MAMLAPTPPFPLPNLEGETSANDTATSMVRWWPWLLLLSLCGLLFFQGLNAGPLWRNEGLRAILAQEMLTSGDWLVPRLYGQPIFTKPPGMYWLIALCSWPVGEVTAWTARLPSALAATALVALFFWQARRHLGSRAALAAAIILPMSPLWLDKVPSAEIDLVQTAWVGAAILFFVRACETKRLQFGFTLIAFTCLAGGVLTKWTAPAFFYLTVIPWLWWRGQHRKLLSWQHVLGLGWAVMLVASWLVAVAAQEGWHELLSTVRREAEQRLLPGRRAYPWFESLTHPLRFLVASLPWSPLALLTLRPSFYRRWDSQGRRLLQLFHCWTWPNLFFWSLATEHHLRHSLPLGPGLAGLAFMVWLDWQRRGFAFWRLRPIPLLVATLVIWLPVKTVFAQVVIPHRAERHHPQATAAWLAELIPLEAVLYLFKLKDETLMFYYGRPVVRLADAQDLPRSAGPAYMILTRKEWESWNQERVLEFLGKGVDSQGDEIVVARRR